MDEIFIYRYSSVGSVSFSSDILLFFFFLGALSLLHSPLNRNEGALKGGGDISSRFIDPPSPIPEEGGLCIYKCT